MTVQCFSFTSARDRCYRRAFYAAGLRPSITILPDGATVHCWVPARPDPSRRYPLLLIHGFGASAIWQWSAYLRPLLRAGFDLYVPDLIFFGASVSPCPERSEAYQARCVMAALEAAGVGRFGLVGVSYGGFVGYWIAAMYPEAVERALLCSAGVCLEERDLAAGLFVVSDLAEAVELLLPRRPEKLKQLVAMSFVRPPPARWVPPCFLSDYIQVMCLNHVKEKTELLQSLINNRKLSDLPKITQPTLIVWGEQDQVFPLELGYRLKRYLGDNADLVTIKNAGHGVNLEKSKELCECIKNFFVNSISSESDGHQCCRARKKSYCSYARLAMRRIASKFPLTTKVTGNMALRYDMISV